MMREFLRKWRYVCAAHEHCSDCPAYRAVGDASICYILGEGLEDHEIETFVRMVCEEYARLEGDAGDDTQDNDVPS